MALTKTISVIDLAKKSIWKGETTKAFSLLFESMDSINGEETEKLKAQLYLYSSNFTKLENSQRQNIISNSDYLIETNKVTSSLLKTISDIESHLDKKGATPKRINRNNSFDIPRDLVSDTLYHGFLITGLTLGSLSGLIFMWMYHRFLMNDKQTWEELFFIAAIGVLASMFLTGAFDGLNRQKEKLVDWWLVIPHWIIGMACLFISGIIAMFY